MVLNLNRISITLCVLFELGQVEHLVGEVWLNEYVDIEIHIA